MDEETTHVIQVRRGTHLRANFPFNSLGLFQTHVSELAWSAAQAFVKLQLEFPDRPNDAPITRQSGKLVLKLPESDDALRPERTLLMQLKALWKPMDVDELGEGGLMDHHSRCSFVVLELVDLR